MGLGAEAGEGVEAWLAAHGQGGGLAGWDVMSGIARASEGANPQLFGCLLGPPQAGAGVAGEARERGRHVSRQGPDQMCRSPGEGWEGAVWLAAGELRGRTYKRMVEAARKARSRRPVRAQRTEVMTIMLPLRRPGHVSMVPGATPAHRATTARLATTPSPGPHLRAPCSRHSRLSTDETPPNPLPSLPLWALYM